MSTTPARREAEPFPPSEGVKQMKSSGRLTAVTVAIAALMLAALIAPPAGVLATKSKIKVGVGPDPSLPIDEETGESPEPYVLFQLKRAKPHRLYRLVVEQSPRPTKKLRCNPGLTTSWEKAFGSGDVAFPPEPVTSGTYFPFAGEQPCRGNYVMEVQERRPKQRRWTAVRAFAFRYPSFSFSYVPTR